MHASADVLEKLATFTYSGLSLHHVTSRKYVKSATKDFILIIVNTKKYIPTEYLGVFMISHKTNQVSQFQ